MKRLLSFVLACVLMLLVSGACAHQTVHIEEETVADFTDFTLSLVPGSFYLVDECVANHVFLVTVTKNPTDGSELAFSVDWFDPFDGNLTNIKEKHDTEIKTWNESGPRAPGKMLSYETGNAVKSVFQGKPCICIDDTSVWEQREGFSYTMYHRFVYVSELGYVFELSKRSPEELEAAMIGLESIINWK